MKAFERPTIRIAVRAGIVCGAFVVLALSSVFASRSSATADDHAGPLSAKAVRGASPLLEIKNEPAPKLFVDPPLPDLLDLGVVLIQWRAENVHILPVFGAGALNTSPRVGHLHLHMDDVPWLWADMSDINTIDMADVPPGPHKVRIELVNANHEVFPGQTRTVTFTVPKRASGSHSH